MTDPRPPISFPVGDTLKILESTVTSGRPRQEILQQLDSIGVEWYVTDQGSLWVRSWQVAAKDFIPIESVAEVRQGHTIPNDADALEWVSANLEHLTREYAGNWIAVSNNSVAAASTTLQELLCLIEAQSIHDPFLTQVPKGPITWNMAYAG